MGTYCLKVHAMPRRTCSLFASTPAQVTPRLSAVGVFCPETPKAPCMAVRLRSGSSLTGSLVLCKTSLTCCINYWGYIWRITVFLAFPARNF